MKIFNVIHFYKIVNFPANCGNTIVAEDNYNDIISIPF